MYFIRTKQKWLDRLLKWLMNILYVRIYCTTKHCYWCLKMHLIHLKKAGSVYFQTIYLLYKEDTYFIANPELNLVHTFIWGYLNLKWYNTQYKSISFWWLMASLSHNRKSLALISQSAPRDKVTKTKSIVHFGEMIRETTTEPFVHFYPLFRWPAVVYFFLILIIFASECL